MIPGQFGPTRRVLLWDLSMSVMRTISARVSLRLSCYECCSIPCCGIPSVMLHFIVSSNTTRSCMHTYVTQSGISAVRASSILFAASGGLHRRQ
jgi:hypothetical protein